MTLALPTVKRGRRSAQAEARYQAELTEFAQQIELLTRRIGRRVAMRGLCYLLEEHGLRKGDFGKAQDRINRLRKDGRLPLDIVLEDDAREVHGLDAPWDFRQTAEEFAAICYRVAQNRIETAVEQGRQTVESFRPIPWHEGLEYACFVLVEKIDLVSLFMPTCRDYRVPIANQRGWADLHLKAKIARYFSQAEERGQTPVLLYCGDHDPAGLLISDTMRANLADMAGATGWHPDNLIVDRFGLNYDFIVENRLSWIDGLETSSGSDLGDPGHRLANSNHVRQYIEQYGRRKVEANALVVRPKAAYELIQSTITKYIPEDWEIRHMSRNRPHVEEALRIYDNLAEGTHE